MKEMPKISFEMQQSQYKVLDISREMVYTVYNDFNNSFQEGRKQEVYNRCTRQIFFHHKQTQRNVMNHFFKVLVALAFLFNICFASEIAMASDEEQLKQAVEKNTTDLEEIKKEIIKNSDKICENNGSIN